ncbi:hypothetical protein NDU88_005479 [Pleurodeles waltl]|uniref:Uncharacterized protein n=1 Tax=Pleurodeles waltl TaxID=8319 RepID=A0AAV7NQI0_PLEWA|nr:hypothetical protein NDU88_005479 [Pleurodeles waltl]
MGQPSDGADGSVQPEDLPDTSGELLSSSSSSFVSSAIFLFSAPLPIAFLSGSDGRPFKSPSSRWDGHGTPRLEEQEGPSGSGGEAAEQEGALCGSAQSGPSQIV